MQGHHSFQEGFQQLWFVLHFNNGNIEIRNERVYAWQAMAAGHTVLHVEPKTMGQRWEVDGD